MITIMGNGCLFSTLDSANSSKRIIKKRCNLWRNELRHVFAIIRELWEKNQL